MNKEKLKTATSDVTAINVKFYFGQALYAQAKWWTLLQPLAANTDCFLVIERGAEMPADVYVVKQTESDKKWERTYNEMGQPIII